MVANLPMRFLSFLFLPILPLYSAPEVVADSKEDAYPALERFVEVLETARERHPDLDKVTYDRMINHALDGLLSSLDRHSSFIHPEMKQLLSDEGEFDNQVRSLGLSLGMNSDNLFVSAVERSGAADSAGIIPNTVILSINGIEPGAIPLPEILANLQLAPGERTTFVLRNPARPGETETTLTHRFVEERSLIASRILEASPSIGYLRLASFGANCAREVESALDDLEDEGMESLILDLRENGGGDLHQTVKILGLFVPPDTAVVSVRERDKPEEILKTPDRQRRRREYPIAVLIDKYSASASELTAGALQDLKRATIIGELSYGKGSVQNIIPMSGATALSLTIATYHTPSGNTPHHKGITPDVELSFTETDRKNFRQSGHPASLTEAEAKSLTTWQDPAIAAAVKTLAK